MKKIIYIVVGIIGVALGAVGAVLPLMPAFPFLMLAAFCFARSSERLNNWFKSTKLYKDNLEHFVRGKGMTAKTKLRVILFVTLTMSVGFFMMWRKGIIVGNIVLFFVWLFHLLYFIFGVKTYNETA